MKPVFTYPAKPLCPKCGSENTGNYNTNKIIHVQYRICRKCKARFQNHWVMREEQLKDGTIRQTHRRRNEQGVWVIDKVDKADAVGGEITK